MRLFVFRFGDTVNTASRMESTSRAYRIHVSETSHRKLMDLGGYVMKLRGITQVKGKGDMQTFWLEGKTGFDKPLPTPAPDNGENHGLVFSLGHNFSTVLSRDVRSLFEPTWKSSPWGNFSDGGLNQSIKRRLSL